MMRSYAQVSKHVTAREVTLLQDPPNFVSNHVLRYLVETYFIAQRGC